MIYDRVNKIGGAERVLLALHEIFPRAPLFTAVYDPPGAPWAKVFPKVIPSFLQNFPLAKKHHEAYPWLMPLAFESFCFDEYDLIISVTSEAAKGIITKPKTLHICYCLTPTRYLWQSYWDYFKNPVWRWLSQPVVVKLRLWDQIASQRPDVYLAISNNVAQRIKKYYGREAEVIYPPVMFPESHLRGAPSTCGGVPSPPIGGLLTSEVKKRYFLIVSRFVPYKRIDIAIEAFNKLGLPLKIVGSGVEERRLKQMAKENIEFLGQNLTDSQLLFYYQNCRAIIFPGEEDFGLVPIEAQACGKPVIAYKAGGVLESVIEGKTGEFFSPQTPEALIKMVKQFKDDKYKFDDCQRNAQRFSQKIFIKNFKEFIKKVVPKV